MKAGSPIRQRVLELLRDHPDGMATLPLIQRLGVTSPAEQQSIASALRGLAERGVVRSTAGTTPSSIWTLIPDATRAPTGYRGAAELTRARARSAT